MIAAPSQPCDAAEKLSDNLDGNENFMIRSINKFHHAGIGFCSLASLTTHIRIDQEHALIPVSLEIRIQTNIGN